MAQGPMETIDELVDFLTEQHDQLKSLLPKVLAESGSGRKELWRQVRQLLAVHEALEQETVHLAAAGLDEVESERVEEETDAADAISELESHDVDSQEFAEGYDDLQGDVVDHAEHEESEEFNRLSGELTAQARERVSAALALFAKVEDGTLPGDSFEEMLAGAREHIHAAG